MIKLQSNSLITSPVIRSEVLQVVWLLTPSPMLWTYGWVSANVHIIQKVAELNCICLMCNLAMSSCTRTWYFSSDSHFEISITLL